MGHKALENLVHILSTRKMLVKITGRQTGRQAVWNLTNNHSLYCIFLLVFGFSFPYIKDHQDANRERVPLNLHLLNSKAVSLS